MVSSVPAGRASRPGFSVQPATTLLCGLGQVPYPLWASISPLENQVGVWTGSFYLCYFRASARTEERKLHQGPCGEGAAWGVCPWLGLGSRMESAPPPLTLFWADREEVTLPTLERDV